MKKSKRIISMVIAFLFVGSLGYFASLTPTGAWLYDEDTENKEYNFATFDVDEGDYSFEEALTFDASTKVIDTDCADDFNNANEFSQEDIGNRIVFYKDVEITNGSNVPVRIYADISPVPSGTDAGIRYFFYLTDEKSNYETIEDKLGASFTYEDLADYDSGYIKLEPTDTNVTLRVLVWYDYGEETNDFKNGSAYSGIGEFSTEAEVRLTAIQDSNDAAASEGFSTTAANNL